MMLLTKIKLKIKIQPTTWMLKHTILNNSWIKQAIKFAAIRDLENNENKHNILNPQDGTKELENS